MSRRSRLILLAFFFGGCLAACNASKPSASSLGAVSLRTASPSVANRSTPVPQDTATASVVPLLTPPYYQTIQAMLGPSLTPDPNQNQAAQTFMPFESSTSVPIPATPTFDIHSIQTSTPAPPASCPQIPLSKQIPTLEYN